MQWTEVPLWIELAVFLGGALAGRACTTMAGWLNRQAAVPRNVSGWLHGSMMWAGGALAVLTLTTEHSWPLRLVWGLFWLMLLVVAATDMESMRIPNRVSLPAAVVFLGLGLCGLPHDARTSIVGSAVGGGTLLLIHVLTRGRGMGLGDVKLYVSIGAVLGPVQGIESLVSASALASLVGVVLLVCGRMNRRQPFAFVPYILAGVAFAAFVGPTFNAWYVAQVMT